MKIERTDLLMVNNKELGELWITEDSGLKMYFDKDLVW